MTVFFVAVALVVVVSAFCSLSEAALYSVRLPYVKQLADSGSGAGRVLDGFKRNMERPITAILIVNTASNTAGAAVAGAQAQVLWGEEAAHFWFPVVFTAVVLLFAEILPKVAGVSYDTTVSRVVAWPWHVIIALLAPLVWASRRLTRLVQNGASEKIAPEEEVHQVAALSLQEGNILPIEAELVANVLRLDEVRARDIMTPRTVVFKLPESLTVREAGDSVVSCPHSRIPIHGDDPEHWTGFVFKSEVLERMAKDEFEVPLSALRKPLELVPDTLPGHRLLSEFLRQRRHILGALDEYGGMAGIVTLEDVIEKLIGTQIVDETDRHEDLQEVARKQAKQLEASRRSLVRGVEPEDSGSSSADDST